MRVMMNACESHPLLKSKISLRGPREYNNDHRTSCCSCIVGKSNIADIDKYVLNRIKDLERCLQTIAIDIWGP